MQALIGSIFVKPRLFLSVWHAVGSLFALSMFFGLFGAAEKRTALNGFVWLGTTLGLPQEWAEWIAAVQAWLTSHQIIASNVLGVLIGVGIFAVIAATPGGPAGATLFVAWGLAQEVGVTGWWWGIAVALRTVLLIWRYIQGEDLEEIGSAVMFSMLGLLLLSIILPIMIYRMFYTFPPKRS